MTKIAFVAIQGVPTVNRPTDMFFIYKRKDKTVLFLKFGKPEKMYVCVANTQMNELNATGL